MRHGTLIASALAALLAPAALRAQTPAGTPVPAAPATAAPAAPATGAPETTPSPTPLPPAGTVHLKDGDRISGRISRSGKKSQRVTTAWGRLLVPNDKIEKIVWADGREESFLPPATPAPAALVPALPARLHLTMTGDSFWYAWDPKTAPEDPTLRLLVSLGHQQVAAYVDSHLDEEKDLPGAVVNTFAFDPAQTSRTVWDEAHVLPPDAARGHVGLAVELPVRMLGPHHLTLAYQWNAGSKEAAEWRDLMRSGLDIKLDVAAPTAVRIEQSRGDMNFGGAFKKSMRKTETFRLQVFPDHEAHAAPTAAAAPAATTAPPAP